MGSTLEAPLATDCRRLPFRCSQHRRAVFMVSMPHLLTVLNEQLLQSTLRTLQPHHHHQAQASVP